MRAAVWIAPLTALKMALDVLYFHFNKLDPIYDNIDYLDYAKQFKFAASFSSFYDIYITSFGRWRSPFQSLLIFIADYLLPVRFEHIIAYLIETAALVVLVVSLAYLYELLIPAPSRRSKGGHIFIAAVFLLFCPMLIGLGRSTLVEAPLAACIVTATALAAKVVRSWRLSDIILLNVAIAAGILWKVSFPLYYFLVGLGLLFYGIREKKFGVLAGSVIFQILVQAIFAYNIVNFFPVLDNARKVSAFEIHPAEGLWKPFVTSILGIPLIALGVMVLIFACARGIKSAISSRSAFDRAEAPALIERRAAIIFALYVANVLLAAVIHLRSPHIEPRYFVFVTPCAVLVIALVANVLNRAAFITCVAIPAALSLLVAVIYSVPFERIADRLPAGGLKSRAIASCEFLGCFVTPISANGAIAYNDVVGEPQHSPVPDRFNTPLMIAALKGRISPGSDVLLIGGNADFNSQTVYYYLRDPAHGEGFYFNLIPVGADAQAQGELKERVAAGKIAAVILRRNGSEYGFTRYRVRRDLVIRDADPYVMTAALLKDIPADRVFEQTVGPEELDVFVLGKR